MQELDTSLTELFARNQVGPENSLGDTFAGSLPSLAGASTGGLPEPLTA